MRTKINIRQKTRRLPLLIYLTKEKKDMLKYYSKRYNKSMSMLITLALSEENIIKSNFENLVANDGF